MSEDLLLAVDPGIRGCGASLFRAGQLVACAYVKNPEKTGNSLRESATCAEAVGRWAIENAQAIAGSRLIDKLALEYPQIYQRGAGKTKGDPNDLKPLCAIDGALALLFIHAKETRSIAPSEWKAQKTHEAVESMVNSRLKSLELVVYAEGLAKAKSLGHNLTDAVGIGLFALGRFDRTRVIHRASDS